MGTASAPAAGVFTSIATLSNATFPKKVPRDAGSKQAARIAVVGLFLELVVELPGAALDPVMGELAGGVTARMALPVNATGLPSAGSPNIPLLRPGDPPA